MRIQRQWTFCLELLRQVAPEDHVSFYAAEIGCAAGNNAAWMLRRFPNLQVYLVDPWCADPSYVADMKASRPNSAYLAKVELNQDWFDEQYRLAEQTTAFAGMRRIILRLGSSAGTLCVPNHHLSFCFIDGDHREEGVAVDLRGWWRKMKSGGIFAGHDYGTQGHDGVKRAVDTWVEANGLTLHVPGVFPRCWWVEKP